PGDVVEPGAVEMPRDLPALLVVGLRRIYRRNALHAVLCHPRAGVPGAVPGRSVRGATPEGVARPGGARGRRAAVRPVASRSLLANVAAGPDPGLLEGRFPAHLHGRASLRRVRVWSGFRAGKPLVHCRGGRAASRRRARRAGRPGAPGWRRALPPLLLDYSVRRAVRGARAGPQVYRAVFDRHRGAVLSRRRPGAGCPRRARPAPSLEVGALLGARGDTGPRTGS